MIEIVEFCHVGLYFKTTNWKLLFFQYKFWKDSVKTGFCSMFTSKCSMWWWLQQSKGIDVVMVVDGGWCSDSGGCRPCIHHCQCINHKFLEMVDAVMVVDAVAAVDAATVVDAVTHHDVIKWKHFPSFQLFVWGIHYTRVDSPHKCTVMQTFDVCCYFKQTVEQTRDWLVIWDAVTVISRCRNELLMQWQWWTQQSQTWNFCLVLLKFAYVYMYG